MFYYTIYLPEIVIPYTHTNRDIHMTVYDDGSMERDMRY